MAEQAAKQRPLTAMSGVGLAAALALWAWWLPADDEVVKVAGGKANAKASPQSAGSPASLDWPSPPTPGMSIAPPPVPLSALPVATTGFPVPITVAAPPVPMSLLPFATAFAVPITVAAPQKLQVGEMNELVVAVGANAGVNEISFTVQFEPDVLQGRAGTEGGWAVGAGLDARFAAEVSESGDRVQIRAVSGQRIGVAGGSVAIVQFQAVAAGTTSVLITDLVVKDLAGKSIGPAVSAANLQMTVDSLPPPQPEAWRQRRAVAAEPPTGTTEDGD
jgi:hypothetical protein